MSLPTKSSPDRWYSLWMAALLSLLGQLWLCQFFSFGQRVPYSIDINPSNLWRLGFQWPSMGQFIMPNWLGVAVLPPPLNPFTLAVHLPAWWFFTIYTPLIATAALLMMAAFLREFGVSRPAAIFGALIYVWQGDLITFVFPGHFAYIATWFFFAAAAWAALRVERTGQWAYTLISGACCGTMVGLAPDRGAIASLLIAALYLAPFVRRHIDLAKLLRRGRELALVVLIALMVALAALLGNFQSDVVGTKLAGVANRAQAYDFVTQFSLGPAETLSYLAPGLFGWYSSCERGPYWGWIGEWPGYEKKHQGGANLNMAISTAGTIPTALALIGGLLLLPGALGRCLGAGRLTEAQKIYGPVLLVLGFVTLIFAWGWHTPIYRALFELPLMDKWRNPLKWLEITNFALITLSALGADHIAASLRESGEERAVIRRRLGWFAVLLMVLMSVGVLVSFPMALDLSQILPKESFDADAVAHVVATLRLALSVAAIMALLFALALAVAWRPGWARNWDIPNPWIRRPWQAMWADVHLPASLILTLAALSVAQLFWVATNFIQATPLTWLTADNGLIDMLKSEGPAVRVSVEAQDPVLNQLLLNQFQANQISSLEISAASRVPTDFSTFSNALALDPARLDFLSGVKNLAVSQKTATELRTDPFLAANVINAAGFDLAPSAETNLPSHAVLELRDYLAKATFVPQVEVIPDEKKLLARLRDENWNPRQTILLSSPPPIQVAGSASSPMPPQAALTVYTTNDIAVEVLSSTAGYLLINDEFDPDWTAQVNGKAAPILRADYIFRAVPVPSGRVTVKLHYEANYHVAGLALPTIWVNGFSDASMLGAWLAAGFILWRRKNQ